MTLQQRIQACKDQTAAIQKNNPEITNVWYQLDNCDYKEMKDFDKQNGKNNLDTYGDMMRLQCSSFDSVIFAFSKPLRIITTIEVIELETA